METSMLLTIMASRIGERSSLGSESSNPDTSSERHACSRSIGCEIMREDLGGYEVELEVSGMATQYVPAKKRKRKEKENHCKHRMSAADKSGINNVFQRHIAMKSWQSNGPPKSRRMVKEVVHTSLFMIS